jgi:nitrate/nitrite transport system permease protein
MPAAANTLSVLEPPPMPVARDATVRPHAVVVAHPAAPALAATASRVAAETVHTDRTDDRQRRELMARMLAPLFGMALFVAIWAVIAQQGSIPGPLKTWQAAVQVFSDPFYRNGPNDQGIGWKIGGSLARVGIGFGIAALIGIPLGFLIGRFLFLRNMVEPVISLLRPVSPLAWLPIGLLVFKGAHPAAIWTIFISSIWPMIINTAVGVQRVPQDYLNIARVLSLSEWKVFTKILFPAVLPYMLTGVRLSMGVAWLVIVAAEMLTGGVGLGFWVWDEWNNLKVENILIAIIVIGVIGLALEQMLLLLAKRWQYD